MSLTYFTLCIVLFPEGAVLALSTHVETREVDLGMGEGFYLEAHGGCNLFLGILGRLQHVDDGRFARVVQTYDDHLGFL